MKQTPGENVIGAEPLSLSKHRTSVNGVSAMTTTSFILAAAILAQPLLVCGLLVRNAVAGERSA
jgi:hypothetical protein